MALRSLEVFPVEDSIEPTERSAVRDQKMDVMHNVTQITLNRVYMCQNDLSARKISRDSC